MNKILLLFLFCFIGAVSLNAQQSGKTNYERAVMKKSHPLNFFNSVTRSIMEQPYTPPYFEDFENLPEEWEILANSEKYFGWGYINDLQGEVLPGHSGDFYLISSYDDDAPRDEWTISPGLILYAGETYKISVWGWLSGYDDVIDEFEIKILNYEDADIKEDGTVVIDKTGSNAVSVTQWTEFTGEYTPAEDYYYYLAIHHCTKAYNPGGNAVCFDDISVELTSSSGVSNYDNGPIMNSYVRDGILYVIGTVIQDVTLYTVDGKQVFVSPSASRHEIPVEKGIYLVRTGNKVSKIIVN